MAFRKSNSEFQPFEFRLTFAEKEELRRKSAAAGVSMSEYVRRAINSCADELDPAASRSV